MISSVVPGTVAATAHFVKFNSTDDAPMSVFASTTTTAVVTFMTVQKVAAVLEMVGGAEVVQTNFRAAVSGGALTLSHVALRWTRSKKNCLQLESPYTPTKALTPHDNACKKYCWPKMVGPAVQVFHVVASGFGAPEKLRDIKLHDVSSYAVMVTDAPV